MSDGFPDLLEKFNAAAKAAGEMQLHFPVFVAHYLTAMRHGTQDADEKRSLTKTMFDMVYNKFDAYAGPKGAHALKHTPIKDAFTPLLNAMCSPECIDFLPRDAAQKMAAVVFKASATASMITYETFNNWEHHEAYKLQSAALVALALGCADEIAKPRPEASVETSKDITPVKRITLKAAEGGQP